MGALLACGVYGACSLRSLQSRLPFLVSPPFHVSLCPSPALVVGWFGHRSVAPPAAPVCWALVGSLLRRYVALAYGRALSFCYFSPGFLPLAFVRPWVGRLRSCLGSCLLSGVTLVFCQGLVSLPSWGCGASEFLGPEVIHGLRDGASCLRSGLCSSSVGDRNEGFPSFWWVWFLAFVRGPLPQAGAVLFGVR